MGESYEITPEPSEGERAAILAALAAEHEKLRSGSFWSNGLLPARGGEEDEP